MNRVTRVFAQARSARQAVFIPFLTLGDPDVETTAEMAQTIDRVARELGVPTILELGVPYSDPIADGPVIQASYTRALAKGVRLTDLWKTVARLRATVSAPIVLMVSDSIVFQGGGTEFLMKAKEAGADGAIVPDLPVEESGAIVRWANEHDFAYIPLVAPTTPLDRAQRIVASATGFVYCVAVAGITGARDQLPPDLLDRIARLRQMTSLPIGVGFGVSKPAHVAALRDIADGVIVGSAIVKQLENSDGRADFPDFLCDLMKPLVNADQVPN